MIRTRNCKKKDGLPSFNIHVNVRRMILKVYIENAFNYSLCKKPGIKYSDTALQMFLNADLVLSTGPKLSLLSSVSGAEVVL